MIGGAVSYVWGSQASLLGRDLGLRRRWVAGVGVGTDFVSLTTLWRAYRRQRYRSWSSADAEGAFCVVCVQFLALCRRWAQQASLLGQVLDCRRRRECTQWCWSASVWQLGAVEEGLCGVVPPKDWQVGATEGTLWALPVLACRGRAVSFTFSITHRIKPHGPYAPKCEEPVSLTSAYMPAIRLICAVRLAGVSG